MSYFTGPFGLSPQKTHQGAGHTGVVETYAIHPNDPNAYFRGTPVKLAGRTNPHGVPYVVAAEPGDPLIGALVEWDYIPVRSGPNYIQGGPALVKVVVDPNMRYHIMVDDTLEIHDYKCHANLTCETGDKCYGLSCVEIDVATVGDEATKQVRIHRTVQAPWGELADYCAANGKRIVEVSINAHQNMASYQGCPADAWTDECVGPTEIDCDDDGVPHSQDPDDTDPTVTGIVDAAASSATFPVSPLTETTVYPVTGTVLHTGTAPYEGATVELFADYGAGPISVGTDTADAAGAFSIDYDPVDGETTVTLTVNANGVLIDTSAALTIQV